MCPHPHLDKLTQLRRVNDRLPGITGGRDGGSLPGSPGRLSRPTHRSPLRPDDGGHSPRTSRLSPRMSTRSSRSVSPSPTKVHRLPSLVSPPNSPEAEAATQPTNKHLHAPHLSHRRSNSDGGERLHRRNMDAGAGPARVSVAKRGDAGESRRARAVDDSAVPTSTRMRRGIEESVKNTLSMPPSKFRDSVALHRAHVHEPPRHSPVKGDSSKEEAASAGATPERLEVHPRRPQKRVVRPFLHRHPSPFRSRILTHITGPRYALSNRKGLCILGQIG